MRQETSDLTNPVVGDAVFCESTGVLSTVPEPGAMSMLVAGLLGLLTTRIRRWRRHVA